MLACPYQFFSLGLLLAIAYYTVQTYAHRKGKISIIVAEKINAHRIPLLPFSLKIVFMGINCKRSQETIP